MRRVSGADNAAMEPCFELLQKNVLNTSAGHPIRHIARPGTGQAGR